MAAANGWATQSAPISSATSGETVTKSDTVEFARVSRAIYVGGTGDVVAIMADDTSLTFSAVPAGTLLPIRCKRIAGTSTTATLMLALY
jgi:hypothetical protein